MLQNPGGKVNASIMLVLIPRLPPACDMPLLPAHGVANSHSATSRCPGRFALCWNACGWVWRWLSHNWCQTYPWRRHVKCYHTVCTHYVICDTTDYLPCQVSPNEHLPTRVYFWQNIVIHYPFQPFNTKAATPESNLNPDTHLKCQRPCFYKKQFNSITEGTT